MSKEKEHFFAVSKEQSKVKTAIVSKYFFAWANVIKGAAKGFYGDNKIAYIDLFAGPGRYDDGTKSTPLLILEKAIADDELKKMLVTIFNDADPDNAASLAKAIKELPGIDSLKYEPDVENEVVGEEIAKKFAEIKLVPTFAFVDPFGYKGLSLQLVNSFLKDWGCDCIFFFNYNRINMGLTNKIVDPHIRALFGDKTDALRAELDGLSPSERVDAIIEALAAALRDLGGTYVLPFVFMNEKGTRTSHHLIFVSKHPRGYEVMKEIMAKESSTANQGVASFQYNPASKRFPMLFAFTQPLDELGKRLLHNFAGRTLSMQSIYKEDNVGTPFVKKNYKDALKQLEAAGQIRCNPSAQDRKANTFADHVSVTFP